MRIFKSIRGTNLFQGYGAANTYPSVMAMYQSLNMLGHNGWDFTAKDGDKIYWDCDIRGEVIAITQDLTAGYGIEVKTEGEKLHKHRFWHLRTDGILVRIGQILESGQLIGLADNTGKYTTGSHLHRDLKECAYINGVLTSLNKDNGYGGCIDPTPFYSPIFILDYIATQQLKISLLQQIIVAYQKILELMKMKITLSK